MKISVITVCFNSARTIRETIQSFLQQDYPDKELYVIDGGSSDDTLSIVNSFGSDLIKIVSEPDEGIYDAMNKGLKVFQGDAIGFLNSDDCYHSPKSLSAIARMLEMHDVVHGHLQFVENHNSKLQTRVWKAKNYQKGSFKAGWMPAHPTFYVRRHVAEATGNFDKDMRIAADYDWMLRAIELNNCSVGLVDEIVIDMQGGGNSTKSLSAYVKGNLESLESRRRWLATGLVDVAFFLKPMRKLNQIFL
jgi:glycosyltransferase involved in cell wall biosynthesis